MEFKSERRERTGRRTRRINRIIMEFKCERRTGRRTRRRRINRIIMEFKLDLYFFIHVSDVELIES